MNRDGMHVSLLGLTSRVSKSTKKTYRHIKNDGSMSQQRGERLGVIVASGGINRSRLWNKIEAK